MTWPIPTPAEQVQFLRNIQRLLAEGLLARAMQLAHSRNVVLRDLKPVNVPRSEPFPSHVMQTPLLAALF